MPSQEPHRDTEGRDHRSRSADGAPVRSAFIALDADLRHDRLTALEGDALEAASAGIDYLHNREDTGGRSFCTSAHLPFLYGGPSGVLRRHSHWSGLATPTPRLT